MLASTPGSTQKSRRGALEVQRAAGQVIDRGANDVDSASPKREQTGSGPPQNAAHGMAWSLLFEMTGATRKPSHALPPSEFTPKPSQSVEHHPGRDRAALSLRFTLAST